MAFEQIPMLGVLYSEGPAHDRSEQMMLYGQFIGSWDGCRVVHLPNGEKLESSCEVHFGWVLEGRAVQDVWISPSRKDMNNIKSSYNFYGSTMRIYDPGNDFWHIIWIDPVTQAYKRMTGRQIGRDIVQEYSAEDGTQGQWCFIEITEKSFHWLSRESKDGGNTWSTKTEMFLQRKISAKKA